MSDSEGEGWDMQEQVVKHLLLSHYWTKETAKWNPTVTALSVWYMTRGIGRKKKRKVIKYMRQMRSEGDQVTAWLWTVITSTWRQVTRHVLTPHLKQTTLNPAWTVCCCRSPPNYCSNSQYANCLVCSKGFDVYLLHPFYFKYVSHLDLKQLAVPQCISPQPGSSRMCTCMCVQLWLQKCVTYL